MTRWRSEDFMKVQGGRDEVRVEKKNENQNERKGGEETKGTTFK